MLSISFPSRNAHSLAYLAKREKAGFQLEPAPTKAGKPEQTEGHLPYHLPYRSSGALFGFRESKVEKCDCDLTKSIFKTSDGGRGDTKIIFKDYYYYNKIVFQADNVRFWAIKKGSTLTIMLQSLESGQIAIDIRPYKSEYKFLHFYKALDADKNDTINGYYYNFKNLSYWIAN